MRYTLDRTKVTFGKGANPPVAGDAVHVLGKITDLAKKCTRSAFTPTITVHRVTVKTPNS